MALLGEALCGACTAFKLTGSSSAAVLSENLAAASWARSVGSSVVASGAVFFASYVGSTKTKSLDGVLGAWAVCGIAGAATFAACGATASLIGDATEDRFLPAAVCCV